MPDDVLALVVDERAKRDLLAGSDDLLTALRAIAGSPVDADPALQRATLDLLAAGSHVRDLQRLYGSWRSVDIPSLYAFLTATLRQALEAAQAARQDTALAILQQIERRYQKMYDAGMTQIQRGQGTTRADDAPMIH